MSAGGLKPFKTRGRDETVEAPIFSILPYFETDAEYAMGQTIKYTVLGETDIRLFEALINFSGLDNPAPTGSDADLNWKEVSPAEAAASITATIPYNQEGGSGSFRYKQNDVIRQWDGSSVNSNRLYVRTGKLYPGNVKVSPIQDLLAEYWQPLGEYGVSPLTTLYHFTDAPGSEQYLRKGTCVYSPGLLMPVVMTPPQSFPGNSVLNVERCDNNNRAKMPCIGLVESYIYPGQVGRVIRHGVLDTLDGSWPANTKLYVGTNGALTPVKPLAPQLVQQVAIVIAPINELASRIFVDIQPPEAVAATGKVKEVSMQPVTNWETGTEEGFTILRVYFGPTLTALQIQINGGAIVNLVPTNRVWTGSLAVSAGATIKWIPTASTSNSFWNYTIE